MAGDQEVILERVSRAQGQANPRQGAQLVRKRLRAATQSLEETWKWLHREAPEPLSRAGEWLLDNEQLIREALRLVTENLPRSFLRELPPGSSSEGTVRVAEAAQALMHEAGVQLDPDQIVSFLKGYQQRTVLQVGELWAFPAFLRLLVLEDLVAKTRKVFALREEREGGRDASSGAPGFEAEQQVGAAVLALRALKTHDWKSCFECCSRLEHLLRQDPDGTYPRMTFETRDRYRQEVEKLARVSGWDELAVARTALKLAAGADAAKEPGSRHVGWYLKGGGRLRLEQSLGVRPALQQAFLHMLANHGVGVYLTLVAISTALLLLLLGTLLQGWGADVMQIAVLLLLSSVPMSSLALAVINWLATLFFPPRQLPRLDFKDGLPSSCRTMVVVPALIGSEAQIRDLLAQMETAYLGNREEQLSFSLLSDFTDALEQQLPEDQTLLDLAVAGIARLNLRYPRRAAPVFHLFHRERRWNPSEQRWMGWERKRGKIEEFCRLLGGALDTSFTVQQGRPEDLKRVRYLITLDADTLLVQSGARLLAGTLAHPLNRAVFDPESGRVVRGYTILQPRVETHPLSANRSLFSRVFSSDTTIDIYTRAVSDVYQDLFGDGVFAGKGILDVRAFERSLRGRVPENALLSHDLFEGVHGRVGLVSDVMVLEDYPSQVVTWLRRMHRWVRGDWQLLPWLGHQVRKRSGAFGPNSLRLLDRWKIFDNLRRSVQAPALLGMLLLGWLCARDHAVWWTLLVLLIHGVPLWLGGLSSWGQLVRARLGGARVATWHPLTLDWERWLLTVVFLPVQTATLVDALGRTLWRLFFSHRHLLQWVPAAQEEQDLKQEGMGFYLRTLKAGLLGALGCLILLIVAAPQSLLAAAPLLLGWLFSPALAMWASRPAAREESALRVADRRLLRRIARRSYLYFEKMVGFEDHWLPPDHFQEDPVGRVAHRTSPTNVGMLLLSRLSAWDLGYITTLGLVSRVRRTFETLSLLPRYRGHFFNWYNTQSLEPLAPLYVSTVDSGNLAASLMVLQEALVGIARQPILSRAWVAGLADHLDLLSDALQGLLEPKLLGARDGLMKMIQGLEAKVAGRADDPVARLVLLEELHGGWMVKLDAKVLELLHCKAHLLGFEALDELQLWMERLHHHVFIWHRVVATFTPWLFNLAHPPRLYRLAPRGSPLEDAWSRLRSRAEERVSLSDVPAASRFLEQGLADLEAALKLTATDPSQLQEAASYNQRLREGFLTARARAEECRKTLRTLALKSERFVKEMDFTFLYDPGRHLFRIGYNETTGEEDPNHYDLLASESRLTSLLAIAKGDVPASHWLHLGRPLGRAAGQQSLLSWGGSLFEYLMPVLFTDCPAESLLGESCRAAVARQAAFARRLGLPWGVSESAYAAFDRERNYQYKSFGVPGLGLKRNLAADRVVAPYASVLALPLALPEALENLRELARRGYLGRYGFFEAVDFTPARTGGNHQGVVVKTFMVHHLGMALLAINNCLDGHVVVRRFHASPAIRAVEHLLYERPPTLAPIEATIQDDMLSGPAVSQKKALQSWNWPVKSPVPRWHLLSNGRLSELLGNAGAGGLSWKGLAVTRWLEDSTLEPHGSWIYVLDLQSGALQGATHEPLCLPAEESSALFSPERAEFISRSRDLGLRLEVCVHPENDVEIRRFVVRNESRHRRQLFICSAMEVALAPEAEDRRHPAFSRLFVEAHVLSKERLLLFQRRRRSPHDQPVCLGQTLWLDGALVQAPVVETDRGLFLGRGGSWRRPRALATPEPRFSGVNPYPLDPLLSLGTKLELLPYGRAELIFLTAVGSSPAKLTKMLLKQGGGVATGWAFQGARERSESLLQRLGLEPAEMHLLQDLFSLLVTPAPHLRARPSVLMQNRRSQAGLWAYGISGDDPILLVHVRGGELPPELLTLVRAMALWRIQGVKVDLVVVDHKASGYEDPVRERLVREVQRVLPQALWSPQDGFHLLRGDQLDEQGLVSLESAARVVLEGEKGTLRERLWSLDVTVSELPAFMPEAFSQPQDETETPKLTMPRGLVAAHDQGGFTFDGREYVIYLAPGSKTPAPWVHVVAQEKFGFLVSERGSGFTWAENSGENRLTPWSNDPVRDPPGEILYLRDEETAAIWTPTPAPAPGPGPVIVRYRAGSSSFCHNSHGLVQCLDLFVPRFEPVKIIRLRLTNPGSRPRRITATFYVEWVLGTSRDLTAASVIPEYVAQSGLLLARAPFALESGTRVAFLASDREVHGLTTNRAEFLGRHGDPARPAGLTRIGLSGLVAPGLDPCGVLQIHLDIPARSSVACHFLLGQGRDHAEALKVADRFRSTADVEQARLCVENFWEDLLTRIQVKTPDPAMDILLNRWLLYQTLACRFWGRSGFYQSSGAFGFRDQLQDVLALIPVAPKLTRAHLLEAARHQFEEGDVLHWWHPPGGRGIRTRCSDDLVWLPYATALYVAATGDQEVLGQEVPFLSAPPLEPGEEERYGLYPASTTRASLYQHGLRALDRACSQLGTHGLPLMGGGDWNDGMNLVGHKGRGESVWLAWFLSSTLKLYVPLAESRGERARASILRERAQALAAAAEEAGWDGAWYRRAFFDDGSVLGSAQSEECRIDALAQAWAVLSGCARGDRARKAMQAVREQLVREEQRLVLLLAPPFDHSAQEPGYIKGYPPGIRENGGQYTHAAVWVGWALAALGDGDGAHEIFQLLNPMLRCKTTEEVARYRVEPYVYAGDIGASPPHTGRGGWSWYTGSAGWGWRFGMEAILGCRLHEGRVRIAPCIPRRWKHYEVVIKAGQATYRIRVENPDGVSTGVVETVLNGRVLPCPEFFLKDDGEHHLVRVRMGTGG